MKCRTPAMPGWRFAWTAAVLALCACTPRIDLQVASDMQTANEMEAVLRQRAIGVERRQVKEGVVLSVADADFARAMSALREAGLPRQPRPRLGDTLGKKGAISTPLEERARYVHALEREIESTVLDIDGVVAARARVVPQQRVAAGAPLTPASASLLIKHRRDIDLSALLPGIVQLVKNGVPGLAAEDDSRVAVVLVPEQQTFAAVQAGSSIASPAGLSGWQLVVAPGMLVLVGGAAGYGLSRWRERRLTGQAKTVRHRDE
ncbi:MAG: type secretion protein [Paraburkholderia sp.]|nr:type secretion protein [Paraburkholderia sp.]